MKKISTFAMLAMGAAMLCPTMQAQKYFLEKRSDELWAESYTYSWNDKGQLTRIDVSVDEDYYEELTYDAEGRCILVEEFQNLFTGGQDDYKRVNGVSYFYNEDGTMNYCIIANYLSVAGYNEDSYAFQSYEYNADGTLKQKNIGFLKGADQPVAEGSAFQVVYYTYDNKAQLIEEEWTMTGSTLDPMIFRYAYDGQGRRVLKTSLEGSRIVSYEVHIFDEETGDLTETYTTNTAFTYTLENGKFTVTNEGVMQKMSQFDYNDQIPASECAYPCSPYDDEMGETYNWTQASHRIEEETVWERDQDGDIFDIFAVWSYKWSADNAGIDGIANNPAASFSASVVNGVLKLNGCSDYDTVRVFDLNGRVVKSAMPRNGKIDLNSLEKGVYVVSTPAGATKVAR